MSSILSQLERLFIQTIPTVIFVFLLYLFLDRFFFRPVTAVLKKRDEETTGAVTQAEKQAVAAEEKARQYEATFQAARQDVYRQRENDRRSILEEREATLKQARSRSEVLVREAQASLAAEVTESKAQLQTSCQSLGQEVADRVLGGAVQQGGGGVQP
jgi:F0F1-type ATP synthase membrane subunit b/b'